jgi:DNA-binding transcriptional regulator YdaS (Cro superfamily)
MSQTIACPNGVPSWPTIRDRLAARGCPAQMRMIDGQLAFPDEEPPLDWHELRIGTPDGMVTVRREEAGVTVVTWGNADATMQRAWNAVAAAFGEAAGA